MSPFRTDPYVTNSVIRFFGNQDIDSAALTHNFATPQAQTLWTILGVGNGWASSSFLNASQGIALL